jgi:hypothetical protein
VIAGVRPFREARHTEIVVGAFCTSDSDLGNNVLERARSEKQLPSYGARVHDDRQRAETALVGFFFGYGRVLTVAVMSPEQTSQIYFRPPSVPRVPVFFRITPMTSVDAAPLSLSRLPGTRGRSDHQDDGILSSISPPHHRSSQGCLISGLGTGYEPKCPLLINTSLQRSSIFRPAQSKCKRHKPPSEPLSPSADTLRFWETRVAVGATLDLLHAADETRKALDGRFDG